MKRSATNAATIANALSQPNRRSDGSAENTVTTRPHANTTAVRISAGPTSTVARSSATAELTPGLLSSRYRVRKWIVEESAEPKKHASANTIANYSPSPSTYNTMPERATETTPDRNE